MRLLLDCTLRMTDEELRAFLWDAGWEKPVRDMERDGLLRVTEVLTRALASDYSEIVEENEYFPVKSLQKAEKRAMIFVNTR